MIGTIEAPQMLARTGASHRQLDYWTRSGYLQTAGEASPGSGTARKWPLTEIPVVAEMVRLSAAGVTASTAAILARGLVERGRAPLSPRVDVVRVSPLGWPDDATGAPR